MPKALVSEIADVAETTIRRPEIIDNCDVVELILKDHRLVESIIVQLRGIPDAKLLEKLVDEFLAHSDAEETEVYRDLRQFMEKESLFEESLQEHDAAEIALADLLDTKDIYRDLWMSRLNHFATLVSEHVAKEEEHLVKHLREKCSKDHRIALGKAFTAAKDKHKASGASGRFTRNSLTQMAEKVKAD
jgi:hemerythrin superfamily protein